MLLGIVPLSFAKVVDEVLNTIRRWRRELPYLMDPSGVGCHVVANTAGGEVLSDMPHPDLLRLLARALALPFESLDTGDDELFILAPNLPLSQNGAELKA